MVLTFCACDYVGLAQLVDHSLCMRDIIDSTGVLHFWISGSNVFGVNYAITLLKIGNEHLRSRSNIEG